MFNNFDVLKWPACSSDCNIVVKARSELSCDGYHNCKQYERVSDLKEALMYAGNTLSHNYLNLFVSTIPNETVKFGRKDCLGASTEKISKI